MGAGGLADSVSVSVSEDGEVWSGHGRAWLVLGPVAWVGLMVCSVELVVSFHEHARPLSRFVVVPTHVGAVVVIVAFVGTVLDLQRRRRSVFELLAHSDRWVLPAAGLLLLVLWACWASGFAGSVVEERDGRYYVLSGGSEEITYERYVAERRLNRRQTAAEFSGMYVPGAVLGYSAYWLPGEPRASKPKRRRHRRARHRRGYR